MGSGTIDRSHEVLILGACPTGLAAIRNIGRQGVKIYAVDPNPVAVGFFSRYCRRLGVYDPSRHHDKLLEAMLAYGRRAAVKPVLIITSDVYLSFVAEHYRELQEYYLFHELTPEIIERFLNKKAFYKLCREHNINAPATYFIDENENIEQIASQISYPCIIKPIYIHVWDKVFKGIKAFVNRDGDELIANFRKVKACGLQDNVMFQEIVDGDDKDIFIYAACFTSDSRPAGTFTGRKIRQFPPGFGVTVMAVGEDNPEFKKMCTDFLREIDFCGLCDVEFKRDSRTGELKIMEINPRVGRWYGVVESCGLNLPLTAYLDLTGQSLPEGAIQKPGRRWVHLFRDFLSSVFYIRGGKLTVREWLATLRGQKKWAIYASDDPMPFFFSFLGLVYLILKSMRQMLRAKTPG